MAFEFQGNKYRFHFSDLMEARSGEQVKVQRSRLTPETSVIFTNTGKHSNKAVLFFLKARRWIQSNQSDQSETNGHESIV